MKPIAIISEGYYWEGESAVQERLVFFGNTAVQRFTKDADPIHATFKLRSILTGDGTYAAVVRHPVTLELVYEAPMKFQGQSAAMSFLLDFFLVGFELKEEEFPEVPNMTGDIADTAGRDFARKMREQKKGQVSHERLTKEAANYGKFKISFVDGYMSHRKHYR